MRALDREVFDAVFEQVKPLIPARKTRHPLGCHRQRVPDRICLWVMVVRTVTGCSWVDAERLAGNVVSDTTVRGRREEWIKAGVFEDLAATVIDLYNSAIGLVTEETLVDGSIHKAPCGGEATGKSPVDRGRLGWKWSIATDANGIPIGWVTAPANCNDSTLLAATLDAVDDQGLLEEIETLHLDRGYDSAKVRRHVATVGIEDLVISSVRPRTKQRRSKPKRAPLGKRWPVERTNSWLSNYGQLRRNTDRKAVHRAGQLALVVAILLIVKLLDQGHLGTT